MYGYDNAPMPVSSMPVQGTFCHGGYPYAGVAGAGCGYGNSFALIVVLFILLVIIGACCSYNW